MKRKIVPVYSIPFSSTLCILHDVYLYAETHTHTLSHASHVYLSLSLSLALSLRLYVNNITYEKWYSEYFAYIGFCRCHTVIRVESQATTHVMAFGDGNGVTIVVVAAADAAAASAVAKTK